MVEQTFEQRIEELRQVIAEEGGKLSEESLVHLRSFIAKTNVSVNPRPSLFICEDGSFRVTWEQKQREKGQIAVRFFDDGTMQYVLFHPSRHRVQSAPAGEFKILPCDGQFDAEDVDKLVSLVELLGLDHFWKT